MYNNARKFTIMCRAGIFLSAWLSHSTSVFTLPVVFWWLETKEKDLPGFPPSGVKLQLSLLSIQEKSIDSGLKNQWWELCRAATEYGVPKTTLKDRPSGRVIHGTKSGRQLIWRCRPFSFPILVGGEEGKGLVALVSTTCANDVTDLLHHQRVG